MEKTEIYFEIATVILSAILSGVISLTITKIEIKRNNKKEIFEKFYVKGPGHFDIIFLS